MCEKQLLFIGDNTVISSQVTFVTHNVSISIYANKTGSLFGKITIGKNCFIGKGVTILYGVSLSDNIIVGARSVVTKSFEESGIIIAGNPAKRIGTIEKFVDNNKDNMMLLPELQSAIITNDNRLIKK